MKVQRLMPRFPAGGRAWPLGPVAEAGRGGGPGVSECVSEGAVDGNRRQEQK